MAQPFSQPSSSQKESMFFNLSQELRDEIYSYLFCSTRLSWGWRTVGLSKVFLVQPASNSLAILKACRRAREEIADTWIGQVRFHFEDVESMLEHLMAFPAGVLPKIRHMRLLGSALSLFNPDRDVFYQLPFILQCLPELRLDVLTVTGTIYSGHDYAQVTELIKATSGWKELRYISSNSEILGFAPFSKDDATERDSIWRERQPSHLQRILEERDGMLSRPSVTIYRSKFLNCPGSILDANEREVFHQREPKGYNDGAPFGVTWDNTMVESGEKGKEVMIIAKRGSGVDYVQKGDPPLGRKEIFRDFPRVTMQRIQGENCGRIKKHTTVNDTYDDVDEFTWPLSCLPLR